MTGNLVAALLLILILEPARWMRLRWNFNETAYIRAWQISVLASGATAIYMFLEGARSDALQRMLSWLPAIFLPIQFTQSFGLRDSMPVSTFSFFARQRQMRNERLGLKDSSSQVNFGNAYLIACIIGATMGREGDNLLFLPGILILVAWALLASRQTRWLPLTIALVLAGGLAFVGQYGLAYAHQRVWEIFSQGSRGGGGKTSSDVTRTAIGSLQEIKLSPEIKWRLRPLDGTLPPRLLRTAGYDKYSVGDWANHKATMIAKDADFADLDPIEVPGGPYYLLPNGIDQNPAILSKLPRFSLRGAAILDSQLPVPGDTLGVGAFRFDNIERNSLGTVQIAPTDGVIDGTVYWQSDLQSETPPVEADDLFVPVPECAALDALVEELGLEEEPTVRGKTQRIARFFNENFSYTRYITIEPDEAQSRTAISIFLTTNRRGHCEYFATSAALLLRRAGVPTRYALGFAVSELDPGRKEFVIRGEHAHAWCRAWDSETGQWIDFDATPPSWLKIDRNRVSQMRWLADWYLRVREDFAVWRSVPSNRIGVAIGMLVIGIVAAVIIGRRLWKSKHLVSEKRRTSAGFSGPLPRTPLHELEAVAKNLLDPRPPGLPFSRWLLGLKRSGVDPDQLHEAIELHQQLRYDPEPPGEAPVDRLKHLVEEIRRSLGRK